MIIAAILVTFYFSETNRVCHVITSRIWLAFVENGFNLLFSILSVHVNANYSSSRNMNKNLKTCFFFLCFTLFVSNKEYWYLSVCCLLITDFSLVPFGRKNKSPEAFREECTTFLNHLICLCQNCRDNVCRFGVIFSLSKKTAYQTIYR